MKIRNLFLATLAALALFACNNSDSGDVLSSESSGQTKSITLNLSGITTSVLKSVGDKTQIGGAITLTDVVVLLTDGTNIYAKKTITSGSADYDSITGSGYIFHEVNPAITSVMVLGNVVGKGIDFTNVASVKNSTLSAAGENINGKDYVTLLGEEALIVQPAGSEPTNTHPNTSTTYYTAAVELAPLVARMEINKIQCFDLGNSIYSSLQLVGLGLVDVYQQMKIDGTAVGSKLSVYTGSGSTGVIYMPGLVTPPAGGLEFGNELLLAWAYDAITPMPTLDATTRSYFPGGNANKAFGYNFLPVEGSFPNVKIRLDNVIRKDGALNTFTYVTTKNFTNVLGGALDSSHPKAGYIYQFDLSFSEDNIGPWDPASRICIDVNVTVKNWVIQTVTPVYN